MARVREKKRRGKSRGMRAKRVRREGWSLERSKRARERVGGGRGTSGSGLRVESS